MTHDPLVQKVATRFAAEGGGSEEFMAACSLAPTRFFWAIPELPCGFWLRFALWEQANTF